MERDWKAQCFMLINQLVNEEGLDLEEDVLSEYDFSKSEQNEIREFLNSL